MVKLFSIEFGTIHEPFRLPGWVAPYQKQYRKPKSALKESGRARVVLSTMPITTANVTNPRAMIIISKARRLPLKVRGIIFIAQHKAIDVHQLTHPRNSNFMSTTTLDNELEQAEGISGSACHNSSLQSHGTPAIC